MLQKRRKKCGENQRQRPRNKAYKCACIDTLSKLLYKINIREHLLQLFLGHRLLAFLWFLFLEQTMRGGWGSPFYHWRKIFQKDGPPRNLSQGWSTSNFPGEHACLANIPCMEYKCMLCECWWLRTCLLLTLTHFSFSFHPTHNVKHMLCLTRIQMC